MVEVRPMTYARRADIISASSVRLVDTTITNYTNQQVVLILQVNRCVALT